MTMYDIMNLPKVDFNAKKKKKRQDANRSRFCKLYRRIQGPRLVCAIIEISAVQSMRIYRFLWTSNVYYRPLTAEYISQDRSIPVAYTIKYIMCVGIKYETERWRKQTL